MMGAAIARIAIEAWRWFPRSRRPAVAREPLCKSYRNATHNVIYQSANRLANSWITDGFCKLTGARSNPAIGHGGTVTLATAAICLPASR
jgi:hypothetical protein